MLKTNRHNKKMEKKKCDGCRKIKKTSSDGYGLTLCESCTELRDNTKNKRKKFVIFRDIDYYPYVEGEYNNMEDANKAYNEYLKDDCYHQGKLYLCEIIKKKNFET